MLPRFTGTDKYYRHPSGMLYTQGVHWLAENAECYWLLDLIGFYQRHEKTAGVWLQDWAFEKTGGPDMPEGRPLPTGKWALTLKDDGKVLLAHGIGSTDFPLGYVRLWLIEGVLMLPSEY